MCIVVNSDKCYERALFTFHNITVEVILENDTLSWSTVTGEIPHEETSRRKSTHREKFANQDNVNSINLQNIYAVTPLYTHQNWSLNTETG